MGAKYTKVYRRLKAGRKIGKLHALPPENSSQDTSSTQYAYSLFSRLNSRAFVDGSLRRREHLPNDRPTGCRTVLCSTFRCRPAVSSSDCLPELAIRLLRHKSCRAECPSSPRHQRAAARLCHQSVGHRRSAVHVVFE